MVDIFIQIIADWLVIPILLIGGVAVLCTPAEHRWQTICRAVVMGLVALLAAKVASLLYQGERPFVEMAVAPGASYRGNPGFPSDHSLLVFVVVFVVWASTKRALLSGSLLVMAVLVAVGRVLALVHTPLDVLGGLLCALLAAWLVYGNQLFRGLPGLQKSKQQGSI